MTDKQKDQIRQMLDDDCSLQELTQKLMELQSGMQYLVIEDDRVVQCTVLAGDITIPDSVVWIAPRTFYYHHRDLANVTIVPA